MALTRCLLMRGARLKDKSPVSAAAQLQCSHFNSGSAASTSALSTQERIASSGLATTSSSGRVFAAGAAAAAATQHAEHIFAHHAARSTSSTSSCGFAFAALAAALVGSTGVALADAAADPVRGMVVRGLEGESGSCARASVHRHPRNIPSSLNQKNRTSRPPCKTRAPTSTAPMQSSRMTGPA